MDTLCCTLEITGGLSWKNMIFKIECYDGF